MPASPLRALASSVLLSFAVHSAIAAPFPDRPRPDPASAPVTSASLDIPAVETSAAQVSTRLDAMSDHGQIAGHILVNGQPSRPFLWDRGVFTDLDPQGEWSWYEWLWVDVNSRGQVATSALAPDSYVQFRALLFDHGRTVDLTPPDASFAVAMDINDRGEVLGLFANATAGANAFLWSDGEWTDLGGSTGNVYPALPKFARGLWLNNRGTVISLVDQPPTLYPTESFIWKRGVKTSLDFFVTAINRHDQVIGNSGGFSFGYPTSSRAYLWENGTKTDLGSLGGDWTFASAINDKGEVAGVSKTAAGEYHVFLWTRGEMIDLGGGTDVLRPVVEEVNDHGQIVGFTDLDTYLWDHGSIVNLGRWDRPSSGNVYLGPRTAIDDHGRVAFSIYRPSIGSYGDTYLWEDGVTIPLAPGTPAPTASARAMAGWGADNAAERRSSAVGTQNMATMLSLASKNPTRGATSLRYAISQPGRVRLEVFDVRGTRIRSLLDEWQAAGTRMLSWDGKNGVGKPVPSGVYLVRLSVGDETRTLRTIVGR